MDIKELNNIIPSDIKIKLKEFAAKFNATPVAAAPAAPLAAPSTAPAAPAATFGEGTLKDGITIIKWNTPELAVGSMITVVTPEGELPAPEGEHELQDGTKIKVEVKDGSAVVTSVESPVAAPAAPSNEMQNVISQVTGFSEQLKTFTSEKETFASQVAEFKVQAEANKAELEAVKTQFSEFVKIVAEVFELPSGSPTEQPRNKFEKPKTQSKINKLLSLAD